MVTSMIVRIRVLIVDAHPIARRGIAFGLSVFEAIEVIGEAASGEEAIKLYEMLRPDVVLMDVIVPGTPPCGGAVAGAGVDGIAAAQCLHAHHPGVRVLILTHYADPATIRAALGAGARGYLIKDVTLDELGQAIQMTYAGQTVLSRSATQALMQPAPPYADSACPYGEGGPAEGPQFAEVLTKRERQVLALVAVGKSNEEIAQELIITCASARTHVRTIMAKLGAANRAEAGAVVQRYYLFAEPREPDDKTWRCGAATTANAAFQCQSSPAHTGTALASAR